MQYLFFRRDWRCLKTWIARLLVLITLSSCLALGHALYTYALMTGLWPDLLLAHLPHQLRRAVAQDTLLQHWQLGLEAGFVLLLCLGWSLLAFRRRDRLAPADAEAAPGGHVVLTLRMMLRFRQRPHGPEGALERWLVPLWWLVALAASACALAAMLASRQLQVVEDWRSSHYWLLAAYGQYLLLFFLTWRLLRRLEVLQPAGAGAAGPRPDAEADWS